MHSVRAILALGLFGYLGYAVWTEQFVGSSSSKSRAIGGLIEMATDRFGTEMTSIYLFATGVILAFLFLILAERAQQE